MAFTNAYLMKADGVIYLRSLSSLTMSQRFVLIRTDLTIFVFEDNSSELDKTVLLRFLITLGFSLFY